MYVQGYTRPHPSNTGWRGAHPSNTEWGGTMSQNKNLKIMNFSPQKKSENNEFRRQEI